MTYTDTLSATQAGVTVMGDSPHFIQLTVWLMECPSDRIGLRTIGDQSMTFNDSRFFMKTPTFHRPFSSQISTPRTYRNLFILYFLLKDCIALNHSRHDRRRTPLQVAVGWIARWFSEVINIQTRITWHSHARVTSSTSMILGHVLWVSQGNFRLLSSFACFWTSRGNTANKCSQGIWWRLSWTI